MPRKSDNDIDRVVHEPARLKILSILSGVESADFMFLLATLGLSKGNLSSHMDRLERAGYVKVTKTFNGKMPQTMYRVSRNGRRALSSYWSALDEIRANGGE